MEGSVGLDLATWLRTRGPLDTPVALTVVEQLAAELDAAAGRHPAVVPGQVVVQGLDGTGPVTARLTGPPERAAVPAPHALAELLHRAVTGRDAGELPAGSRTAVERVVAWARDGAYADAAGMAAAARAALGTSQPATGALGSGHDHRVTRVVSVPSETAVRPAGDSPAAPRVPSETLVRPAASTARPAPSETLVRPVGEDLSRPPAAAGSGPAPSETLARPAGDPPVTGRPAPSETLARPADEPAVPPAAVASAPVPAEPAAAPAPARAKEPEPPAAGVNTTTPSWSSTIRPAAPPVPRRRRRGPIVAVLAAILLIAAVIAVLLLPSPSAALQVTGATVTIAQPTPGCDTTVRVVGTVRTNSGDGTITYRWLRSDGTTSPPMTQTARAGTGSYDVPLLWTVSGPGRLAGTATLQVLEPDQVQAQGTFTYDCR